MNVSLVVPGMILMFTFYTMSRFRALDCDRVARPKHKSMTLSFTQFDTFRSHFCQQKQSLSAL